MAWFNPFQGGGSGGGSSTAYATSLVLELNPETYVLTATLKNKNGDTLGTSQTIDLPLETMVVSGRYDSNTKTVILVLSNEQEISFSVADLISGLQSEITIDNKLSVDLISGLGTAAKKDVPVSGNASTTQVVMGDDTRLTDARPASDVSAWAKELTKPSYSYSEIVDAPSVNNATLTIQKNGTEIDTFTANASVDKIINITIPTSAADVSALPSSTKYGSTVLMEINSSTFVVSLTLKDQDGNTLGTTQTIDLPLESVVVGGSYNDNTKKVILTLQNGNTIEFSIADLVAGLQNEITSSNKLNADLVDDSNSINKFASAAQLSQIATNTSNIALKANISDLGTAAAKDVPSSGNAASGECVLGNDTRLSDARPASDVSSWAKAGNKPSYSYSEITGTPTLGTAANKDVPTSGNASATQVVLGNDGRLAWMDTNGDIYFGATRIARIMDEDSYADLVDSDETENIYYLIYPTPTNGRSLSVNLQNSGIDNMRDEPEEENEGINELEEPIEEEPIEETPSDDDMR